MWVLGAYVQATVAAEPALLGTGVCAWTDLATGSTLKI